MFAARDILFVPILGRSGPLWPTSPQREEYGNAKKPAGGRQVDNKLSADKASRKLLLRAQYLTISVSRSEIW